MKLKEILKSETTATVASVAFVLGPYLGVGGHSAYLYATSEKVSDGSAQVIFYPDGNAFRNSQDDFSFSIDRDKDGVLDEKLTFVHGQRCVSFVHRQPPFERDQEKYFALLKNRQDKKL